MYVSLYVHKCLNGHMCFCMYIHMYIIYIEKLLSRLIKIRPLKVETNSFTCWLEIYTFTFKLVAHQKMFAKILLQSLNTIIIYTTFL